MKTIQEIKEKYAIEQGFPNWDELRYWRDISGVADGYMDEICIRAQKVALEKAAENATTIEVEDPNFGGYGHPRTFTEIYKKSITNPENLIR